MKFPALIHGPAGVSPDPFRPSLWRSTRPFSSIAPPPWVLDEPRAFDFTAERICDLIFVQAPGTIARLDLGTNFLVANCGRGAALIDLARMFPRSRFFGLEFDALDVAAARDEARARSRQNIRFESDLSALPHLVGSFQFALRLPRRRGVELLDLARLLQKFGLSFDVHPGLVDPQSYRDAGLTGLRQIRLPDCFCTIARK